MKKFQSLLMIAMALFTVACGDDDEKNDGNAQAQTGEYTPVPTPLEDNTFIYDGITFRGECRVTTSNNVVQYALVGEFFQVSGNIGSTANTNSTIDLTKHYEDMMFAVHINLENNQGTVLDMQYQNYPQNYWCFLNGESLGATSCFKSGTATVTMADGNLTLVVDGTLINGKSLKYKIVYKQAEVPKAKNEIVIDNKSYPVDVSLIHSSLADLSYEFNLYGQGEGAPIVRVEVAPASLGKSVFLKEKKSAVRYRVTIFFHDSEEITACQDAFFEDVISSYWNVAKQEGTNVEGCIFTNGILSTKKDDKTISMSIDNGPLTNGRSVSAQASVDISDITELTID